MSTDFLNRRMDLIHEFKDGTHYLTMDTSYPVKLNGLVLKLFVATSTYKADQVKDDSAGIAFSIKSANNVGEITYEPMITDIKKSNVLNFKNQLLKDDAFVEGDYVMAVIDLFNDKLYICSQTDFARTIDANDLSDICNFKMFDLSEETADRLAMAVAFQKDGIQPLEYKEHFSLTRNGNPTDETHGDYTVYQLISKGDGLEEIPVADTYVSGMNEISIFIHPFAYLSLPGYSQNELASVGYCYKSLIFTAIYGYLNTSFLNNFCMDYDFLKKYIYIDKSSGQTKFSLYNDNGGNSNVSQINEKFNNFINYIPEDKRNDYYYLLNTGYYGSSFGAFYGDIFPIRKSDGLLSILTGGDLHLLYDDKSRFCIDMSGENSKFSGERWGFEKNNYKSIYYVKSDDNKYSLKISNKDVSIMTNDKYFDNVTNIKNESGIDPINDPWIFDGEEDNSDGVFTTKKTAFNVLRIKNVNFSGQFNLDDGYRLQDQEDDRSPNNYMRDKNNSEEIIFNLLGKPTINLSVFSDYKIKYTFDVNESDRSKFVPKVFTISNNGYSNIIYAFVNFKFLQSITSDGKIPPHGINKYINFKVKYNMFSYIPYTTLKPILNTNNIVLRLNSTSKLLNGNTLEYGNSNDTVYYKLLTNNNSELTLYSFLNFRIFNFKDENIVIPGVEENDYYYGSNNKCANSRVMNYKIDNNIYDNLYIKYFSSIADNTETSGSQYGVRNIYTVRSSDKKSNRIFIKCKCDDIDYIISIAAYSENAVDTDNSFYGIVKNFSTSFDDIFNNSTMSTDLSMGPYSYCLNYNSELVSVDNRVFEFEHKGFTYVLIFDKNGNFKSGIKEDLEVTNISSDTIKYCRLLENTCMLTCTVPDPNTGGDGFYFRNPLNDNVAKRNSNYTDPLLLTSNDDFFILHHEETGDSKISFISSFDTLESQLFNRYLNQFDDSTHSLPRINQNFFEDGTLAGRNYSIPSITEELGEGTASYYRYLNYIKSHSCLELFNTRKDYTDSEKFDQVNNNNLDKSIYLDSEGHEKTIYEFFKTILKYYGNGSLKKSYNGYTYSFISKSEIEKTITDSNDWVSLRPHHFVVNKKNKTDLDIDAYVFDSDFVKYRDNEHGDTCRMSIEDGTEFEQYIYIKKNGNVNVVLTNSDTEAVISFGTTKMFTIGNGFNTYGNSNKIKFEILQRQTNDDSDVIILKTKVPIANIYAVYLQNDISTSSSVYCNYTEKKEIIKYGNESLLFTTCFMNLSNNGISIDICLTGEKYNYETVETNGDDIRRSFKSYSSKVYSNYLNSNSDNLTNYYLYNENKEKIKLLLIGKILPRSYFFSIGEYKDPENKSKGYLDESIMKIDGFFNENNITSSAYYELPKKYQSSETNIYKSVVEAGLRKSQSISLTDDDGNLLSLNGTEKKEVDKLTWYDLLMALSNNQYIDILGEDLLNLKKSLADNPDIMSDLDDLTDIRNDLNDIKNNILAKLSIIKFYYEVTDVLNVSSSYDLETIITNMQELSCLELEIPEEDISTNIYYKDLNLPYYQTIGDVMKNTKVYGGRLTVFKFNSGKIYMEFINKGNDTYFTKQGDIYTEFNNPSIWIKKNSPKVYSEINTNLDYNKDDFVKTVSGMNPNSTMVIDFPYNDDINNLDKTSIIYAGAVVFEANGVANPNFNYNINVTLNCNDDDKTVLTLNSVRTDCAGMTEATVNYLGYKVAHSSDTIGVKVADFYQMTTDEQHIASIKDKQNKTSNNFRLIKYSKDSLLPGDLIIYEGRYIEQYIYTDSDGIARGLSASTSDNMKDSTSLATYITNNKSIPSFSSKTGAKLNIDGLNIGLDEKLEASSTATTYKPDYILRYRYINGNNFLPYSIDDDGYLEAGGHLVIQALKPNDNIINLSVEFTNYRNDKYSKYIIMNKIGDLNYYCTFKWLSEYVNMNKLNHVLVNWHDAIMEKATLSDADKKAKTEEYKAEYAKLPEDSEDKKKYTDADKYAEAKLNEYINSLPEVEKEPAKKEIIYGLTSDTSSNHIIELQSFDYKVLNFDQNESNLNNKELCLKVFSSIEPSIMFEDIPKDKDHTALNSSKLIYNASTEIVNSNRAYKLTISNPFFTLSKTNAVTKYKEQVSMRMLYKRINPDIVDIESK